MIARAETFRDEVRELLECHPIVRHNAYTAWFSRGEFALAELRRFTVQFSVFSHLFIEAQLRKCINAPDVRTYRASKEILMNELGVVFGSNGSIEGSSFRFNAAHFEWLAEFARHLGLKFDELGKRSLGTPSTLLFCDTLLEHYGSSDRSRAAGASFAIEHWAAAGFWKELIAGLRIVKRRELPELPLGFWTWHDRLEDQHAAHTENELAEISAEPDFNSQAFLTSGRAVLDAVAEFWNGLHAH